MKKQITSKQVVNKVKSYLKQKEYPSDVMVKSIGSTIIVDNLHHSSAAQLCEWATGYKFIATGFSMCRLFINN